MAIALRPRSPCRMLRSHGPGAPAEIAEADAVAFRFQQSIRPTVTRMTILTSDYLGAVVDI